MKRETNLLKGVPAEERMKYEYELMMNWGICPNKILEEAYLHIKKCLLTKNTNFSEVRKSNKIANRLHRKHRLSFRDIHQHVYLEFVEQKKDEKFDSNRAGLFTYTAYHTHSVLRALNRKYDIDRGDYNTFLYLVFDKNLNPIWQSDCLADYAYEESWKPLLKSQSPLFDKVIENDSPEDILIKKEFWDLVYTHYDDVDVMVLLGRMKKTEASAELQINYDAYCKRLKRKNDSFRIIATKAGHC